MKVSESWRELTPAKGGYIHIFESAAKDHVAIVIGEPENDSSSLLQVTVEELYTISRYMREVADFVSTQE